ncbi:MAG: NADP-dependent isocitrate dehydrogenase [Clostridiales Family XIII bacterium]|jgi:isocitrate dehydrogenase|nr:NADP-dependent isocitrate dehydrogenase [Clostridiales Family XIII bacterium]
MPDKIKMDTPLVEMDGDEMTRVIWANVKELLIEPFVELRTEYYDLALPERERTKDEVTIRAAEAVKEHGVGVKCATITPNDERVKEYGLTQMYKSPNGTIRALLGGTVFRAPILAKGIVPYIPTWKKPITIARHAYGDIYKNTETTAPEGATAELIIADANGVETRRLIHRFAAEDGANSPTSGVVQGIYNTDESIAAFARACMDYAVSTRQDLWFGTKDTISKIYDRRFRDIFQKIYDAEYEGRFKAAGIEYFYTLIDDLVARVIRSEGGFIWACKNYDGDVMSDMVATAYGSLAMMSSVLVSPDGFYEYEAAHGTVQRHYIKHQNGEPTSTNSVATIYAWAGALTKRGELDHLPKLLDFGQRLKLACVKTIESGVMTGDLYALSRAERKQKVDTETFLIEAAEHLHAFN